MIKKLYTLLLCLCFVSSLTLAKNTQVKFETTEGDIIIECYDELAPITVQNFLKYVKNGHYNGTHFHRVIEGFMIQGGGYTEDMQQKDTLAPIKNEASNGLKNKNLSIAMARTSDPHSATSQFFINVANNSFLNHTNKNSSRGWGYTVFGTVLKSSKGTIKKIEKSPVKYLNGHQHVPIKKVIIKNASIL